MVKAGESVWVVWKVMTTNDVECRIMIAICASYTAATLTVLRIGEDDGSYKLEEYIIR
jgi:hypothetical protein